MSERAYETLILLSPELGEAGGREQIERVRALMEEKGAKPGTTHEWGTQDLAYEIADHKRANFNLIEFTASPQTLEEIERNLKLMEPVLRFLSVRRTNESEEVVELRIAEQRSPADGPPRHRGSRYGGDDRRRDDDDGRFGDDSGARPRTREGRVDSTDAAPDDAAGDVPSTEETV